MFNDEVLNSDAFLDLPHASQLLYVHLSMGADDDGFVSNPKMIMRILACSDEAYQQLITAKFVLTFPSGVCVIKHWRINNYIRKDVYVETKYTKEKSKLLIRENGTYTFTKEGAVSVPSGHFALEVLKQKLPVTGAYTDRARAVHSDKDRLGKDSIDKIRDTTTAEAVEAEETEEEEKAINYSADFLLFWEAYPKQGRKGKANSYKLWSTKLKAYERAKCKPAILKQVEANHFIGTDGKNYPPHVSTWLNQKRWEDDVELSPDAVPVQQTKTLKI